ncbi:GAF domain-containing protein [Microvirga thermotolerans]|uniref:GAF domain-containing protein n=1 Tax=Microvirga thermotolerans TaxID=2651334 RepID=A0A5P9JXD9_9HYPH|nr:GAF domain-containing protein [Microvirga thermotolerans]QFU16306.1 GAF domain-containing protein [Microvirga thermotolerans]
MTDLMPLLLKIQDAWAAPDQPRTVLEAAGEAFAEAVGHRLYTVTRMLAGGREVERIHSTNPEVYPVGGRKPILPNAYTQQVRQEMKPFLARTPAGFAPLFPDHQTITGLGLGCVMNLPVVFGGAVLGTVNLLDREGAYDERHVEPAMLIARQILPVLLERDA